jgi:hypothetical protein
MRTEASYEAGKLAALEEFGLNRRMPSGPKHLGAERLADLLSNQQETHATRRVTAKTNPLERPTLWGEKAPVDSGSMATQGYSGVGQYGGV